MSQLDRIPPDGEPLEFVQTIETGTVHIVCYGPDRFWTPASTTGLPAEAQAFLNMVRTPCRMLCGAKLLVSAHDFSQAVWSDGRFPDDDLCVSCVKALGGQQSRAFHVDNRGESNEVLCRKPWKHNNNSPSVSISVVSTLR
jgi:hypothetical protein